MLVPDFVREFEPYIPSKPDHLLKKYYNVPVLHRLNNNENPLGPPKGAVEALNRLKPKEMAVYPSGDAYDLKEFIAEKLNLHPDQIIFGNGANEIIQFVIKAYCSQGDNIITGDKTFAVYEWVAEFSGVEARLSPMKNNGFDLDAMLAFMDERTKIIFICNPNNPTGTYVDEKTLINFLDKVDGRAIVVLDEAYCEFVDKKDFPDGTKLIDRYDNLLVFRTFSKMYGLAGLRIGYLMGSREAVYDVCRTRIVYSINSAAQSAAIAAFGDSRHIEDTKNLVSEGKSVIIPKLESLGLDVIQGEGNYVIAGLPFNDQLAYRKLIKKGFMVRTMTSFRFPNHIRITIREKHIMEALGQAVEEMTFEMKNFLFTNQFKTAEKNEQ
jgi:histidinol-phosphate aminotransferase